MSNTITSTSSSSTSYSSPIQSAGDRLKHRQQMHLEQMLVQVMNTKETLIDDQGEIAGKKLENENAIKNQNDNEQEYKKQKRHKIIHAIVSFFSHVISLVMIVVRPVKSIAKMVTKGIKKAVSKTAGKSMRKTASHMMKHIGKSVKHGGHKGANLIKSGKKAITSSITHTDIGAVAKNLAKKLTHPKQNFSHFMKSDFGRLVKREAMVNGGTAALNGIGDGANEIQISKIEKRINDRDNQNELINANGYMAEQQKKQQIENSKQLYQMKEDGIKLANTAIKHANDISSAFINQAA
ncbi:YopB/SseC family type III secretion system translocon subunit [Salmonella enterica]|nr:hypothetical protein [Salmonella enterica]EFQ6618175.1 YopB/SseC family type III secretion system translocon subunit [Salmonella enterica]